MHRKLKRLNAPSRKGGGATVARLEDAMIRTVVLGVSAGLLMAGITSAAILHVHDSAGVLGTVDSDTGAVSVIGDLGVVLTDIAFDPMGNLFGISFDQLYSVNANTAATALIGSHGVPDGNALVFGADGTLYSAGFTSNEIFTINPATGATASLGTTGFASGGDLAFVDSGLFLASEGGELVSVDLADPSNSAAVGPFGVANVFGIATSDNGTTFGVGGTEIFTVNLATGAAVNPVDYGGQGLADAFGQSFFTEAGATPPGVIPLPASVLMLLSGVLSMFWLGFRRRRA
jgi:hypothetical protein